MIDYEIKELCLSLRNSFEKNEEIIKELRKKIIA